MCMYCYLADNNCKQINIGIICRQTNTHFVTCYTHISWESLKGIPLTEVSQYHTLYNNSSSEGSVLFVSGNINAQYQDSICLKY